MSKPRVARVGNVIHVPAWVWRDEAGKRDRRIIRLARLILQASPWSTDPPPVA